jgi:hypothetical protein
MYLNVLFLADFGQTVAAIRETLRHKREKTLTGMNRCLSARTYLDGAPAQVYVIPGGSATAAQRFG